MKLTLNWHKPLPLRKGRKDENLIYACDALNSIPLRPGIYVFARRYGGLVIPIYVGQALRLRNRIKSQLNNAQLMMGITNMENGRRFLLLGEFVAAPGQKVATALDVLERAFIETALTGAYELLNKQGTKTPVHTIQSTGKRSFHQPFPHKVNARKK